MKYLARFIGKGSEYYRTVWGDNPNEATRMAERYAKKGYILHSVKSQF